VSAKVLHVDPAKARIFLSIRRTSPNPLLETLDSLVTSSSSAAAAAASAAAAALAASSGDANAAAAAAAAATAAAAAVDQREALGDLPEAVRFCEVLRAAPGVVSATLGVRLTSRATSQELEVYMAREAPVGSIGDAELADAGRQPGGAASYNLVLRKEQSVQEVAVVATLTREEVRAAAGSSIAALAAEAAAA
jgi:hypothetical protein